MDMEAGDVLKIVISFVGDFILALIVARRAGEKGRSRAFWFFFSFILPGIGALIVRNLEDRTQDYIVSSTATKQRKRELTDEEKKYSEQTEKLREEKLKSITLKDGYQFASVPSRIFVEKIEEPGRYCCPYCYAEVSSDVSSMCANCGKSLGVEAPVVPAPKIEPVVNMESEKLTEAPAKSNPAEKKSGGRNKKIFVGVGIGAAVLVAVLAVILIVNNGSGSSANVSATSEYNQLVEKLERLEKEVAESEDVGSDEGLDEYGGLAVGSILRSDDNLRLRAKENTDSAIITTMVKHTKVKILKIGWEDESEGVESNWVLVEVLPGGKDRDGNRIPDGTAGWCFGGFLESFSE